MLERNADPSSRSVALSAVALSSRMPAGIPPALTNCMGVALTTLTSFVTSTTFTTFGFAPLSRSAFGCARTVDPNIRQMVEQFDKWLRLRKLSTFLNVLP